MTCDRRTAWAGPLLLLVIAVVAVVSAGCGSSSSKESGSPPLPTGRLANDAEVRHGREIFTESCATCHGVSGGGGLGPSFNDGKLLKDFSTIDAQVEFVKHGRGVMPPFANSFSDAQIRAVVRYEREVLSKR